MGVTTRFRRKELEKHSEKVAAKKERTARHVRAEQRAADELDELIEYGRAALTAPGSAPLAMQLDTALRVAGLHLRRAERSGNLDDVHWAVTLASFVADRCEDTPPASVVELGSRAFAVLDMCAKRVPESEVYALRATIERTRDRVDRAEQLCALSLDDAISSLVIAKALVAHAPKTEDREVVLERARSLLATAAIAARRAGNVPLADAALTMIESATEHPAADEPKGRRGRRRSRA